MAVQDQCSRAQKARGGRQPLPALAGGGGPAVAGINRLPAEELDQFLTLFHRIFPPHASFRVSLPSKNGGLYLGCCSFSVPCSFLTLQQQRPRHSACRRPWCGTTRPSTFASKNSPISLLSCRTNTSFNGTELRAIFTGLTIDCRVLVLMDKAKPSPITNTSSHVYHQCHHSNRSYKNWRKSGTCSTRSKAAWGDRRL